MAALPCSWCRSVRPDAQCSSCPCPGRDVEDKRLVVRFDKTRCIWRSLGSPGRPTGSPGQRAGQARPPSGRAQRRVLRTAAPHRQRQGLPLHPAPPAGRPAALTPPPHGLHTLHGFPNPWNEAKKPQTMALKKPCGPCRTGKPTPPPSRAVRVSGGVIVRRVSALLPGLSGYFDLHILYTHIYQ